MSAHHNSFEIFGGSVLVSKFYLKNVKSTLELEIYTKIIKRPISLSKTSSLIPRFSSAIKL